MVRPTTSTPVRLDDNVVVDVTTERLEPRPNQAARRGSAPFQLHLTPGAVDGVLRLRLPSAQSGHAAGRHESAAMVVPPIFADRSDLAFRVTAEDLPIPASVEGILDAARRLPSTGGPAGRAGDRVGSRVERPYLLRLRLPRHALRIAPNEETGRPRLRPIERG
jgi:hypothetical protein